MKIKLADSTVAYLIIGCAVMLFLQIIRKNKYDLSIKESIISFVLIVFCGVLGTFILFYIENGLWGGISFYGSIMIGPLLLYPFAKLFGINYRDILSWCSPTVCVVHIFSKINCYVMGCCGGKDIYNFYCPIPLQLLEAIAIFIIMLLLIILEHTKINRKIIFPTYLVLYGFIRYILNYFRKGLRTLYFLPAGHLWSVIVVIVGILMLMSDFYEMRKVQSN